MQAACTSPGSRCAPLVLSLANEPGLRCYSHVDERGAGFFALGLAKSSRRPVAVACTSGTALAELLPAAIEAREARVPLMVLSADRPAELRENGSGQTIDQLKLFGSAAKWFFEVEAPPASAESLRWIRTLACRAYATALEDRPGVVHLNFPLRDPLVCQEPLPRDPTGRSDGRPYLRRVLAHPMEDDDFDEFVDLLRGARRGLVVAGRYERGGPLAEAAAWFCGAARWPLLADPLSGARTSDAAIAHYDHLLRHEPFLTGHRPDVVVRVGDLPVSKPLRNWLAGLHDVPQIAFDLEASWQDPAAVVSCSLALDPSIALFDSPEHLWPGALPPWVEEEERREAEADDEIVFVPTPQRDHPTEEGWLESWRGADACAAEAIGATLAGTTPSEPAVAGELGALLPADATLFVASSMPVRDIECFWPVRADPPEVLCNRGANGIDGTVSTALGVAANGGPPVVLMIGDVALAHDMGGLLALSRHQLELTIVLLDNGGGGIFEFLPLADSHVLGHDAYTEHVATPTGMDFARLASLFGLAYERPPTIPVFRQALERALEPGAGSTLIHVRGERGANRELHRRVEHAVQRALGD